MPQSRGKASHGAETAANETIAKHATLHSPSEGESQSGDFGARQGWRLLCCASEGGHVGLHARYIWKASVWVAEYVPEAAFRCHIRHRRLSRSSEVGNPHRVCQQCGY